MDALKLLALFAHPADETRGISMEVDGVAMVIA